MRKRLLWRRSATALGIYGSTALGILGSIILLRILGPTSAGRFSLAVGTAAFFQLLLELTGDEALVKYGFHYAAQEDWGRFHRLVRLTFTLEGAASLAATLIIVLLAPFADSLFNTTGMLVPMLLAAALPPLQALESMGAAVLILRSRYDIRGALLTLSTGLRLIAIVIAAPHGVSATVAAIVVAQLLTSICVVAVGFVAVRRFPRVSPSALGGDRSPVLRFVLQSSIGTTISSLRGWIAPLSLGIVQNPTQVGFFRAAQAPQQGFAALSSPVRLILLTEQTRDWEQGKTAEVMAGVRNYVRGATALVLVALVPGELLMGWMVRVFLGEQYMPAVPAARLILIAAAIQVVFGWSKSLPVSIGQPGLRTWAYSIELAVMLPLILVFGSLWGATGAAGAVVASSVAYAIAWAVMLSRLRRDGPGRLTPTGVGAP